MLTKMKLLTGLLLCSVAAGQSKVELKKLSEAKASDYPISSIDWLPSSGRIVAVDSAGIGFLMDPAGRVLTKEKIVESPFQHEGIFYAVGVHPKSLQMGFSVSGGLYTSKYSFDKMKPEGPNSSNAGIRNFFYHTTRNHMWAFGPNWIKMLNEDFETMRDFTEIPAERGVVSQDESTLICAPGDSVVIFNAATGKELKRFKAHEGICTAIAISRDGKFYATGGSDKLVKVWSYETNETTAILKGHTVWINSIDFIPDSDVVVSGSDDRTIRVWNFMSGECMQTIQTNDGSVRCVKVSPDGKSIAVSGGDGKVVTFSVKKK